MFWVCLSLIIVTLLLSILEKLTWASTTCGKPRQTLLTLKPMLWLNQPLRYLMTARHTSVRTIRERGKDKVYYSQVVEGTQHAHCHTAKLPIERESMNLGFCFIEGEGRVPGVSQIHSLLVNLKPKSIN